MYLDGVLDPRMAGYGWRIECVFQLVSGTRIVERIAARICACIKHGVFRHVALMYHDCISLVLQRVLLTCIITRIMERVLCYVSSLLLWRIGQTPAPCTEIRAQYAIRKQNMPPQQQCLSVERRILIILV